MTNYPKGVDELYIAVRGILEQARASAWRAVDVAMVEAYWRIGFLIVEHEQKGSRRAEYGKELIQGLSHRLVADFGRGFSPQNLRSIRQFYLTFRNLSTVRSESHPIDREGLMVENPIRSALRSELTWTHYKILMRVEHEQARQWYMTEATDQHWSTRQLERQIGTLYYERLLASQDKPSVRQEADQKLAQVQAHQFIRDPYVLEFLGLKDYPDLRESDMEAALINNLQTFLLELGKGFSFVARQKRLHFGDEDFYVDLVFYNFLLKCFVLIDLKIGKLTHQDIGRMDGYVRMYEEQFSVEGDSPTIGLILCSDKNEAVARYSVLHESTQLFASKYKLYLPDEEELREELERGRRLIEGRVAEDSHKNKEGHNTQ